MSDLKPGIYKATVRGVPDQIVLIRDPGYVHATTSMVDGEVTHSTSKVSDARPLILLDHSNPAGLLATLNDAQSQMLPSGPNYRRLADLIDQIEAQTKPPKPTEPTGLGAVVRDADGVCWVRVQTAYSSPWVRQGVIGDGSLYKYSEIDAVRVLSEGVQP